MKWTTVILSICFLLYLACSNEPADANGPDDIGQRIKVLPDTAEVAVIDQYRQEIRNNSLNGKLAKQKVKPHLFSDEDTGLVLRDSGEIVRAGFRFFQDSMENMIVYHFKGGKLVHADLREWHKLDNPYAIQILAYFNENEKIFQVEKRYIKLESGENPSGVVGEPLIDDMAQADSLTQAFKADWERILKAVKSQ